MPIVAGSEITVLPQLENALLAGHDELTLQYGLVPRTNRGIFAINELPTVWAGMPTDWGLCDRPGRSGPCPGWPETPMVRSGESV